jgi:hypothetical protein
MGDAPMGARLGLPTSTSRGFSMTGYPGKCGPQPTWGVRLGRLGSCSNEFDTSARNNEQGGES